MPLACHAKKVLTSTARLQTPWQERNQETPKPNEPSVMSHGQNNNAAFDEWLQAIKSTSTLPERSDTAIRADASKLDPQYMSNTTPDQENNPPQSKSLVELVNFPEASRVAEQVYQLIVSKSQLINEQEVKIRDLQNENLHLKDMLRSQVTSNENTVNEVNALRGQLDATMQAAAQLHAQQSSIMQEQTAKLDLLKQQFARLNCATTNPLGNENHSPSQASVVRQTSSRPASSQSKLQEQKSVKLSKSPAIRERRSIKPDPAIFRRKLHIMDAPIRPTASHENPVVEKGQPRVVLCQHNYDFDTNGVLYLLGRKEDGTWENPAESGRVTVLCGAGARGKELFAGKCKEDVLDRTVRGDSSSCFAFAQGWFTLHLGDGTTLTPTHYSVRNGGGLSCVMTGWTLEGSMSGAEDSWVALDDRSERCFLDAAEGEASVGPESCHHSFTFEVQDNSQAGSFSWFRLRQTRNKAGNERFFVQGFELYGHLTLPSSTHTSF